jgi:hypothetical protein
MTRHAAPATIKPCPLMRATGALPNDQHPSATQHSVAMCPKRTSLHEKGGNGANGMNELNVRARLLTSLGIYLLEVLIRDNRNATPYAGSRADRSRVLIVIQRASQL